MKGYLVVEHEADDGGPRDDRLDTYAAFYGALVSERLSSRALVLVVFFSYLASESSITCLVFNNKFFLYFHFLLRLSSRALGQYTDTSHYHATAVRSFFYRGLVIPLQFVRLLLSTRAFCPIASV